MSRHFEVERFLSLNEILDVAIHQAVCCIGVLSNVKMHTCSDAIVVHYIHAVLLVEYDFAQLILLRGEANRQVSSTVGCPIRLTRISSIGYSEIVLSRYCHCLERL